MRPEWPGWFRGPVTPVIEDAGLAAKAAALLPPEPWSEDTWGIWTKAVAAETGAKGRGLFHPLRLALTGLEPWTRTQKIVTPDRARPGLWRAWKEEPRDGCSRKVASFSGFRFAASRRKNPSARPEFASFTCRFNRTRP